jgi:hypothetical protein
VGSPLSNTVNSLSIVGPDLYAAGRFENAGGDPAADGVARWDGAAWHPLGSGLNDDGEELIVVGSNIFVAGAFTDAGGDPQADYVACWGVILREIDLPLMLRNSP